jgi:phosphoribosylanthranilate isomerase
MTTLTPRRLYIKICGNTNYEDALCATEAGADMLGFIFYPPSPRAISIETAGQVVAQLRAHLRQSEAGRQITLVGVFVNETAQTMLRVLEQVGLDLAQLSGNETTDTLSAMSLRAFKAVRGKTWSGWRSTLGQVASGQSRIERLAHCPDFLLDADHETLYGGSGLQADTMLAAKLCKDFDVLLAGGLNSENVAEVVKRVQPWGVDVASGTEAHPGKKDHDKVRAFIRNAQLAAAIFPPRILE